MASAKSKFVIGLVGGVGAGKSLVAREFEALGCAIIDGDKIGHQLLADDKVCKAILDRWDSKVLDSSGQLSRAAIAKIVFENPQELAFLNGLLHPMIRQEMQRQIEEVAANDKFTGIVIDAAVLLEAGWDDLCDHLVFVKAPDSQRFERVNQARGWDSKTWGDRENSQISLYKKASRCEYTIDNSSDISYLRNQVHRLFHQLVNVED